MLRTARFVGLMALMLVAGCATQVRGDSLTNTLKAYASTLRWGDFASAAQFVDPATLREHPLTDLDMARYQQVRVTDYNDDAGPVPLSDTEVRQTVRINLINVHTQAERTVIDNQIWRYDAKTKHWWLASGLPDITRQ